jgi:DNA polymerase-3 subunit epsilon
LGDSFVAVDVETANADLASVCSVGVVSFTGGQATGTWESLVDPEDYFDPFNVEIHGITEEMVVGAPRFEALLPELRSRLADRVVVSHTAFDRVAFARASERYGLMPPLCTWLDSARIVRRTWPEFARSGYGLANVAGALGVEFDHHVAAEDARAAGEIVLLAITQTGIGLSEWLRRVKQPIGGPSLAREGNPDGPLAGEVVVFTGSLMITRREAADLAAEAGCSVAPGVTKHTTLLVVGQQDIRRLAGCEKSSKHRKAELLAREGQPIRILGEDDFRRLVKAPQEIWGP